MKQPRAFTLVVVLVVVVLAAAVVAGVLSALRSQNVSAIRAREETAARGIAEACADRMFAYSTTFIRDTILASGQPPLDFDPVLDPDGNPTSGDEFVPAGGVTVFVPPMTTNAMSRYALFRLDGGACLIRFDDNSDDWHPGLGSRSEYQNVDEGPEVGDEVVTRDRDRSIWVNVIGVFPAFDDTADADVWTRAHARVSIRRFLETAGGPAIWAKDDIHVTNGGLAVCGLGGMESSDVDVGNNDAVCACGHQKHGDINEAINNECNYTDPNKPGDMCDDPTRACEPNLREEGTEREPPVEALPPSSVGSFNKATRSNVVRSRTDNEGACMVWIRDADAPDPNLPPISGAPQSYRRNGAGMIEGTAADGVAYIYVSDEKRASISSSSILSGLLVGDPANPDSCASPYAATSGACGQPAEACPSFQANAVIPPPCSWDLDTSGTFHVGDDVKCDAGESRCWIPLAVLDGQRNGTIMRGNDGLVGATRDLLSAIPALSALAAPILDQLAVGLMQNAVGLGEQSIIDGATSSSSNPTACGSLNESGHERLAFRQLQPAVNVCASLVIGDLALSISSAGLTIKVVVPAVVVAGVTITPAITLVNIGPLPLAGLGGIVNELLGPSRDLSIEEFCGGGCTGANCTNAPSFHFTGGGSQSLTSDVALGDQDKLPRNMTFIIENGPDPVRLVRPNVATAKPVRVAFQASGDLIMSPPDGGHFEYCCPTCNCVGDTVDFGGVARVVQHPRRMNPNRIPRDISDPDCDTNAEAIMLLRDDALQGRHTLIQSDGTCVLDGRSTLIGAIRCNNVTVRQTVSLNGDRTAGGCFIGGVDGGGVCGPGTDACAAEPTTTDKELAKDCTGGTFRVNHCDDVGVCLPRSVAVVGNVRSSRDVCIGDGVTVFGQVVAGDDVALQGRVVVNHSNAGSIGAVTQAQAWVEGTP